MTDQIEIAALKQRITALEELLDRSEKRQQALIKRIDSIQNDLKYMINPTNSRVALEHLARR